MFIRIKDDLIRLDRIWGIKFRNIGSVSKPNYGIYVVTADGEWSYTYTSELAAQAEFLELEQELCQ
jgi:hypothetical protein